MTCPRNFTKDQLIAGLKAGRTLVLDRRDAPELDDLLALEADGLVEQQFVEIDDQSSAALSRIFLIQLNEGPTPWRIGTARRF
jgi:hypothetical protein